MSADRLERRRIPKEGEIFFQDLNDPLSPSERHLVKSNANSEIIPVPVERVKVNRYLDLVRPSPLTPPLRRKKALPLLLRHIIRIGKLRG